MKRALAFVASDYDQLDALSLKEGIRSSEGRILLAEIAAPSEPMYPEITNAEIASAFGADLVLIKHMDYATNQVAGLQATNPIATLKKLSGLGIGLNLEITDDHTIAKYCSAENIQRAVALKPDFLSLTGYSRPEVTIDRVVSDIQLVRKYYKVFLMVNAVVAHGSQLSLEHYRQYITAGADMVTLPAPGTVPGVNETNITPIVTDLRALGAIVSLTTSTSQEGTGQTTARDIALAAKRCGTDVYAFGDAGICGWPNHST